MPLPQKTTEINISNKIVSKILTEQEFKRYKRLMKIHDNNKLKGTQRRQRLLNLQNKIINKLNEDIVVSSM